MKIDSDDDWGIDLVSPEPKKNVKNHMIMKKEMKDKTWNNCWTKVFHLLTYDDVSILTRQKIYGCLQYSRYWIWNFVFYCLSLFSDYIILVWYENFYWAVKLTPLHFSFFSQSYRMLMIGYGLDVWVSRWIDRMS